MSKKSRKNSYFGRRMPSSRQHDFGNIPSANIQRSVFNRSSAHKTAIDSGLLIPVFVDEALPGDTFHLKTSLLARLSTPIVPFMDNLKLDIQYFSVPYRLVWDNWQRFNGEQTNPGDSVDYLIPQLTSVRDDGDGGTTDDGFHTGSLADYFGIPTNVSGLSVSALPFRAYNLIYNEWYRDQNLIDSSVVTKTDAQPGTWDIEFPIRRRGKRHDYFTSCLPWPQKGDGVELSLGTPQISDTTDVNKMEFEFSQGDMIRYGEMGTINDDGGIEAWGFGDGWAITGLSPVNPGFSITNSDALTINSLRQAFQLQRLLERDARGGTRYTEIIRSHFGVISPDSRIQRPEYLGGGSFDININPVLQNSASDQTSPQGNLAAFGVSGGIDRGFSHSFVEHCFVIGVVSVRADLTYQQGIPRMFSRKTRFDHFWPTLAHLGEQSVLNKEIYAQGAAIKDVAGNVIDEQVFGYQERYAEYRYKPSQITNVMRSTDPLSTDIWHLAQEFGSLPVLNKEFIEEHPPLERVLAVQDQPQILMDMFFQLRCARPMPVYSVPGYIDHF